MTQTLKKKSTHTMLAGLTPDPDSKTRIIWDTDIPGLGVRVTKG